LSNNSSQDLSYEEIEPELEPGDAEVLSAPRSAAQRRGMGVGFYLFAFTVSAAALGLGYYARQLRDQNAALNGTVTGLEQARTELVREREESQRRVAQLLTENEEERARAAQAMSEGDQLRAELAAATTQRDQLAAASAESQQQLAELAELRSKFQRMIDSGALDISIRRGRMIVEMPAAVLFESGSAELSPEGTDTIIKVAKVLRSVPRHRFLVGGHTDNVPAVKTYKSNWELSAARAVRVTETLTSHGVSANRLVIAGYSEYDPIATNVKETGRQKNRRIEIILEPYLESKMVQGLREPKPEAAPAAKAQASK
jgi:chemotaxis protein MotB